MKTIFFLLILLALIWEPKEARSKTQNVISDNPQAELDPKTGAFLGTWIDASFVTPVGTWALRRHYNSRSLHLGIFGLGWCSDFDRRILIRSDHLRLQDCFLTKDLVFPLSLPVSRAKGLAAQGQDGLAGRIFFVGLNLEWHRRDGRVEVFNPQGLWIETKIKNKSLIKLIRHEDGSPHQLWPAGEKLKALPIIVKSDKIQQIGSRNSWSYFYQADDLTVVREKNQLRQLMSYDAYSNLIRSESPQRILHLSYQNEKDRLAQLRDETGCEELYSYYRSKQEPQKQFLTVRIRTCQGRRVLRADHRFERVLSSGQTTLKEIKTQRLQRQAASHSGEFNEDP